MARRCTIRLTSWGVCTLLKCALESSQRNEDDFVALTEIKDALRPSIMAARAAVRAFDDVVREKKLDPMDMDAWDAAVSEMEEKVSVSIVVDPRTRQWIRDALDRAQVPGAWAQSMHALRQVVASAEAKDDSGSVPSMASARRTAAR